MSSKLMMALALLLLLGAIASAYWGLGLTKSPVPVQRESVPVAAVSPLSPVGNGAETRSAVAVVLARDVNPHTPLSAPDLLLQSVTIAPPGSYNSTEELIGRSLWRALPAGTILRDSSFSSGGPLAHMIRPHERALAIEIDQVKGAGGHLQPNDYVDVLLFLRQDDSNHDHTMQVVVPALRVIAVGPRLGLDLSGETVQASREGERGKGERAAVLAVPEQLLTRFALAAQVGKLQLAVRSASEERFATYLAGHEEQIEDINRQLFQFQKLALRGDDSRVPGKSSGLPRPIEVIKGGTVSRQIP